MEEKADTRIPIPFHFAAVNQNGKFSVEKADTEGRQRRYVQGISSGIKTDKHSERMTEKCINSFMEQANSGDVLLYPDLHGIRASADIGILTAAEIMKGGDWFTEYRLYDEMDDVDTASKETADKIWKQTSGLPPYRKPIQKGFSIEGFIPDGAILSYVKDAEGNIGKRVIDEVLLDGVVIVGRPAYGTSIASACYKALGEMAPAHAEKIVRIAQDEFNKILEKSDLNNKYFQRRWELNDALESAVVKTMKREHPAREEELRIIFNEYAKAAIPLIQKSATLFLGKDENPGSESCGANVGKNSRVELYKSLLCKLEKLLKKY